MYAIAIGVALVVVVPVLYAVLGGFRTTGQIVGSTRSTCRARGSSRTTREILTSDTFWRQVGNSVADRRDHDGGRRAVRVAGRVRARPVLVRGPGGGVHRSSRSACCSR